MAKVKWEGGAWWDQAGRPVCVRCERVLDGHYTICIHCKTNLSRSQMDAADRWDRWNRERFKRAEAETDDVKRRAILGESYMAPPESGEGLGRLSGLDILIVKLWDKANGQPGYDKTEWQQLQLSVEDLRRRVRESAVSPK